MDLGQLLHFAHAVVAPGAPDVDHGDLIVLEQVGAAHGVAVDIGAEDLAGQAGFGIDGRIQLGVLQALDKSGANRVHVHPERLIRFMHLFRGHAILRKGRLVLRLHKPRPRDDIVMIGIDRAEFLDLQALGQCASPQRLDQGIRVRDVCDDDIRQIGADVALHLDEVRLQLLAETVEVFSHPGQELPAQGVILQVHDGHEWVATENPHRPQVHIVRRGLQDIPEIKVDADFLK